MRNNKLAKIILWAFILNTLWEFAQCLWFFDMWSWSFWKATIWMWAAIFGDILIVLGVWKVTTLLVSSIHFARPSIKGYAILLLISFIAAVFLEWIAVYLELWSYNENMPVVSIGNHQVGILPIIQITLLPALSIYATSRFRKIKLY